MTKVTSKKKFARKSKRVVIYGGLGNQLFGWSLAAHLQSLGVRVRLLQARDGLGNKTHGISATQYLAFGFTGDVGELAPFWHVLLSLARRSKFVAHVFRVTFTDSPSVTVASIASTNARWMVGYHQNFNPSQLLSEQQMALGVNFSDASHALVRSPRVEAARQGYVAVHVRGGDLRYLKETAGLLSPGYFVSAIQCLFSKYDIRSSMAISVVTDDIEAALDVCDALGKKGHLASISDAANNSLEAAFQELSQADYLVVSNSSFSYWAAIAGKPKLVAYPSPWRADRKEALPVPTYGTWTAVESDWSQGNDLPAR